MEKRKIYLSGKITGDEGFAEKFKAKEEELAARGDYVFNPALHPDMFTHGQFMQIDLLALSFCDSIYLMDNWRESKGAKMEFEQAKVLGLDVEFEKEPYILLGAVGYYSDKSDEFDIFDAADISADDMFATREEAEKARNRLLHKEAGNVQVLPASEVFGGKKDISFEKTVKDEQDISKVRDSLKAAIEEKAGAFETIDPLGETEMSHLKTYGTIETPRGTLRLTEEDRQKFSKSETSLKAIAGTLGNPDIVLEKETFNGDTEEFKPIEIFGKVFKDKEGNQALVLAYRDKGTVTVGTKGKDLSHLLSQIKTSGEISYVRPEVSRAASVILSNGKQQPPSMGQSEKINENTRHVSLDLGNLFNRFKEKNGFEPINMPDGDYLRLSHAVIRHSVNDGTDYYDLMNSFDKDDGIVCMDGETCKIVSRGSDIHGVGCFKLEQEDAGLPFVLSDKEFEYASQKIDLTKSFDDKKERYAPESFIRDVQEAIAPNPYMSDAEIMQTAKNILFERDIALGLEDSRRLAGLNPTDYTAKERDKINEALIALGGTQYIVDILKNTDPADVKPLMDSRKQFETLLDKEGIKHTTNKDGTYSLDCGKVIFDLGDIQFSNKAYKFYFTTYHDSKIPNSMQKAVKDIVDFKNSLEKKVSKKQQDREVER